MQIKFGVKLGDKKESEIQKALLLWETERIRFVCLAEEINYSY